jgi:hypothetical protein
LKEGKELIMADIVYEESDVANEENGKSDNNMKE